MRYFYTLCLLICLLSCKAKSDLSTAVTKQANSTSCPENGNCSYDILKNKTIQIKTDNLGSMYPEIIGGSGLVLKFEYKKSTNTEYEDSSYREEIFIELDENRLEFVTDNFKQEKLFFARWCYCKGQTGYYKIQQGKLAVTKINKETYQLQLSFNIEKLPQITETISYAFSIQ